MSDFDISFNGIDDAVVSFYSGETYDVHFYNDSDFSVSKRDLTFTPVFKPFLFLILIIGISIMISEVVKNAPTFIVPAALGALLGLSPITKMLFGFGFLDILFLILGKGNVIFSFGLSLWWGLYLSGVLNGVWQVILCVPCMYGMFYYPFYAIVSSKDDYNKVFKISIPLITILGGLCCFLLPLILIPDFESRFAMYPIILPTAMGFLVNFLTYVKYLFNNHSNAMKLVNYSLASVGVVILFFGLYSNIYLSFAILILTISIFVFPVFIHFFKQVANIRKIKKIVPKSKNSKYRKIKLKKKNNYRLFKNLIKFSDFVFFIFILDWWLFLIFFDLNGLAMYISGTVIFWYMISYLYDVINKFSKINKQTKKIIILSLVNIFIISLVIISYIFLLKFIAPFTVFVAVLIPTLLFIFNIITEILLKRKYYKY